ncbi:MAG: hypothetical protein QE263_09730 [Vampirovibrionales bacterium]|nr:hypothetical protein [Vampirovibrionales bacterium]
MVSWNSSPYSQPYDQPRYPSVDDRSVDTNQAIAHAARYDANQDGVLDRFEINLAAKAAERIDQSLAELFHTFNSGGKDCRGLLPDANNNNALDLSELVDLANQVDEGGPTPYSRISVGDFKKGFPGQTVDGGNDVYPGQNNSSQGGMQQMVMKLVMALLQMLIQPQQQDSYQRQPAYSPMASYGNDPFAGLY